ncbi:hypothetical protein KF707_10015 [Candidatus Obscuribacterales bacterium]|nr:hypothetical protein [Candidatus Obscuribacterales bacterium]MBX3136562.1 hypothetical protein [Candidatus Obscuribacterales bacterium]MBX3151046.1 hypothetical protein [Candidatus Obscuribacterales bacterium]
MQTRLPGERKIGWPGGSRKRFLVYSMLLLFAFFGIKLFVGTIHGPPDEELKRNVHLELVDWHIVGLWVINSPCCWVRVANYNDVPIKNITIRYKTFGYRGEPLDVGTYTLSGAQASDYVVKPRSVKNFIEQYIGLVALESDMLSVELLSVERGPSGGH